MAFEQRREKLPWDTVIFVADPFVPSASDLPPEARADVEQTDAETMDQVLGAVRRLGLEAVQVDSPKALIDLAPDPRKVLVLSTYGGMSSRNRLLLTPAVCETQGLAYVGLDAVGHALASNKREAKRLAADCGVATPMSREIRRPEDLGLCDEFPVPYVLKPIAEGSSIGIGQQNLIRDARQGAALAAELLERFDQPVLIEAFVPGSEASLVCVETAQGRVSALVEVVVEGQPDYFDSHLFDAGEKMNKSLPRRVVPVAQPLCPQDAAALDRLLRAVGHYGYCRVDGKLHGGRFQFLELTPDAWLGKTGQLAAGLATLGWDYDTVIAAILTSATLRPPGRVANG